MRRQDLEFQADRIEMVLASHHLPTQVWGGVVTPRFVRYHLSPALGTRLARIQALSEEIALSLGVPSCRIIRNGGTLNVEIPRVEAAAVRLLPLLDQLAFVPPCTPVLGLDETGVPILLNLTSPDVAHVLLAGTTGSGKTALARAMIISLALHSRQRELQLALFDPKGRGFAPLDNLPHLLFPVVRDPWAAPERLHGLVAEMERRDRMGIDSPRVVIFIDELADLILVGGAEVEEALTRLTQRGREAGLHLVACTQKPTVAVIGSLVKSNFPVRIVGSVTSPEDAKVASGLAGTGAERLLGRGDFLIVAKGQVTRLQAAFISDGEIAQVLTNLNTKEAVAGDVKPWLPMRTLVRDRLTSGGRQVKL